jgi:hypothetical protein
MTIRAERAAHRRMPFSAPPVQMYQPLVSAPA